MRGFLKNILLFIVPILIITLFFECYLRNKNTIYHEKEIGLVAGYEEIEVLILGNSHSHYGIDPNQISLDAYNMAMVGQSFYFEISTCVEI